MVEAPAVEALEPALLEAEALLAESAEVAAEPEIQPAAEIPETPAVEPEAAFVEQEPLEAPDEAAVAPAVEPVAEVLGEPAAIEETPVPAVEAAEPAAIVDVLDSAFEIEPDGEAVAVETVEAALIEPEPAPEEIPPAVESIEPPTSEVALDSALEIEDRAAPDEMGSNEAAFAALAELARDIEAERLEQAQAAQPAQLPGDEQPDRAVEAMPATVIPLRPVRETVAFLPPQVRRRGRAMPLALAGMTAAWVGLAAFMGVEWRSAVVHDNNTQQRLATATDAASNLVFELAAESRRVGGATSEGSKAILDEARKLQGSLVTAGPFDPTVLLAQGDAAMDSAKALAKAGNTADALKEALRGQRIFQTLWSVDPDKEDWAKRLAAANVKIGDVLVAQNSPDRGAGRVSRCGDHSEGRRSEKPRQYRTAAGIVGRPDEGWRCAGGQKASWRTVSPSIATRWRSARRWHSAIPATPSGSAS